jgi:alkylation response protein AidB-like acyl-CoA dehydrogenase
MPLEAETLELVLHTLKEFGARSLPLERRLELDKKEEYPAELIKELVSPEVGLHLVFLPEEHGGLGGGAYDVYRVSEGMARIDLGIATSMLAIALGTDPIRVGATAEQQARWMTRIADEGLIVAYGVTEPGAGSNVASLKTKAEPIVEDGKTVAYRLNGTKQFITNGSVADLYTILAKTPNGPSFFAVERGTPGLEVGKSEEKHGIRASNTAQLILEDLVVPASDLVGLEEGQGLLHASKVFAFTRLMVAAFGLGAGEAALEKAIAYGNERSQFGSLLTEKQGYTHKLLVPHEARLAASRAFIEEVALRIDEGDHDLATEGAMAKLHATEAGNAAAEAAIQAFGGYGYTHEYEVEKIKRDVRITMIYEGTSEILQNLIAINRWRESLTSKGRLYLDLADEAAGLDEPGEVGGQAVAAAARTLVATIQEARRQRLTRQQFLQFQLADAMVAVEAAMALARKASRHNGNGSRDELLMARSRLSAREAARLVMDRALTIVSGGAESNGPHMAAFAKDAGFAEIHAVQAGAIKDMDLLADSMRQV